MYVSVFSADHEVYEKMKAGTENLSPNIPIFIQNRNQI